MRIKLIRLLLPLFSVAAAVLYAAEDPTPLGNWPGYERFYAKSITVQGEVLYTANVPAGIQIYDISDVSAPRRIGSFDAGDAGALEIAISGTNAYVAYGSAGLRVFDVTNPGSPKPVSTHSANAMCVSLSGNYAFVGERDYGLRVLDVSNTAMPPARVGGVAFSGFPSKIAVAGTNAYVATTAGLHILDISNPRAPRRVKTYLPTGADTIVTSVAITGKYALVTFFGGLQVLDLSNPAAPVKRAAMALGWAATVVLSGDYAYVALPEKSEVAVVALGDPAAPVVVRRLRLPDSAQSLEVSGDTVFAGLYSGAVLALDATDPVNLHLVGSNNEMTGRTSGVALSGDYAFLADYDSLKILNVTNPAVPFVVSSYQRTNAYITGVSLSRNLAFIACSWDGVKVIDVSNVTAPRVIGGYNTPGECLDVVVAGDYAFVADGLPGLHILDVSNPAAITRVGGYATANGCNRVVPSGDLLYVADALSLTILSVTNRAAPRRLGAYNGAGALDMAVRGNLAFIVSDTGLTVLDVSNPAAPRRIGGFNPGDISSSITVSDNRAYLGTYNDGVYILDISNPAAPRRVGRYDTIGLVAQMKVQSDRLFAAESTGGFSILQLHGPLPPLSISRGASGVVLSWPSGFGGIRLERTAEVGTGMQWSPLDLPEGANEFTARVMGEREFFRLRKP